MDRGHILTGIGVLGLLLLITLSSVNGYLVQKYEGLESPALLDRTGALLTLRANEKGQYGRYSDSFSPHVQELVVKKEDRFFYYHPGINPVSAARALVAYVLGEPTGGASTIAEQLVKNMLGHEQDRSFLNKLSEALGALCLELFNSKERILTMYMNSVYLGNQVRGLGSASELYFGKPVDELDDTKLTMLLATLSSPSAQNPWKARNAGAARNLAARLSVSFDPEQAVVTPAHDYAPPTNFELASMHLACTGTCTTTIDADLTKRLRSMLAEHVDTGFDAGARSGAIIVLKEPENELLAILGSPNPTSMREGQQINMAIQARAIGSTVKPFIYLQGFTKGLRPYTLVNDREYKFPIGSGFPLYPKNYDGLYHGWVTLHTALSNSLNVPSVQTLEFIGLTSFYGFLEQKLHFAPLRDLDDYQYGIALGALDMDPLTLAEYLSIFPREGSLTPLRLFTNGTGTPFITTPMSSVIHEEKIADPKMTALVTKVLSDRLTGVSQFGLKSNLNLPQSNYAVKTGTSEDYHDSWTVGYTPDFLVVVWFGNPDNTALKHITGQSGAGSVWHDAMQLLMNSPYNKKTAFNFSDIGAFTINGSVDFGLRDDTIADHQHLLPDTALIASPHNGDNFQYESGTAIPLVAEGPVAWSANGTPLGSGTRLIFYPSHTGAYAITATDRDGTKATVTINLTDQP